MLIAPAAGSESAKAPDDGAFDVALVVVHGMGNAFKSQILLEWAEPLLERMDWVARDRIIGADETPRRDDPRLGPLRRHADGHRHGPVPEAS